MPKQTHKNSDDKKRLELQWAKVFLDYINHKLESDYLCEIKSDEHSLVDVVGESASGKWPNLILQMTFAVEVAFTSAKSAQLPAYGKRAIIDAIERKAAKCMGQEDACANLILIIQGYMSRGQGEAVFADSEFESYAHFPFKGIYYVSPAMIDDATGKFIHKSYVHAIKNCF